VRELALLAFVGCGAGSTSIVDASNTIDAQSADAPRCAPSGTASVSGSVIGASIAPVQLAQLADPPEGLRIVIADTGPAVAVCQSGFPASGADLLHIPVCTATVGTYDIASCGAQFYTPDSMGGSLVIQATGGMLVIDSLDAACTDGTFDITFETGDVLTGSFAASVCP
jgi:hypothetical protein